MPGTQPQQSPSGSMRLNYSILIDIICRRLGGRGEQVVPDARVIEDLGGLGALPPATLQ